MTGWRVFVWCCATVAMLLVGQVIYLFAWPIPPPKPGTVQSLAPLVDLASYLEQMKKRCVDNPDPSDREIACAVWEKAKAHWKRAQ